MKIPFNRPFLTGHELDLVQDAMARGYLSGNGEHTKWCQQWLINHLNTQGALLTHSCTAALEMAALLCKISPGDEIIMPSYTFVSTANAFVLRGAVPVFVDIRPDTLNIDETLIEEAITSRTRAIVPVHYAGVACEMEKILHIARKHHLFVIEDAAQAINATYRGRALGTLGDLGCLSFHETKNIISGEGGALLINSADFQDRAEILWEKGTNRSQFFKGFVDKYTWVDVGSSFLPSEITAAFLRAQLEHSHQINDMRLCSWNRYHQLFEKSESSGNLRRPIVPKECSHNGHIYYLLMPSMKERDKALDRLKENNAWGVFHYVPLHSSPAGKKYARYSGSMSHTNDLSGRLLRLPLWPGLPVTDLEKVANIVMTSV